MKQEGKLTSWKKMFKSTPVNYSWTAKELHS